MNELISRAEPWQPTPGGRVRLRLALDRPRALDGKTGTVRYCWPYVADGCPWLIALDEPVLDGGRAVTLTRCSAGELEPVPAPRVPDLSDEVASRGHWLKISFPGAHPASEETVDVSGSDHCLTRTTSEVVTYRDQSAFVGREQQLADFAENLALSPDDDRRRFVYNVFGPSGVGKTWLLRRFRAVFHQAGGVAAWSDDAEGDAIAVMEQLAGQFEAQGWPFGAFVDELRHYREQCRAPLSATDLADLEPSAPFGGFLEPDATPDSSLTPLFLDQLRAVASERPVGLFFDTNERTHGFLDRWLQDILDGRYGDLPGSTVVVVAGKTPLDNERWCSFDPVIARVPLGPFTDEEARVFLAHNWIHDDRIVRTIQQVSGRLPVLVATMAVRASDHLERLGEPERNALDCFLASLGDPIRRSAAIDAALPRQLDVDVLADLIDGPELKLLVAWLRKMPFVDRRAEAWTYRQAVRDTLLRHVREASPQRWTQLQGRLAAYFERLADDLEHESPSRLRDATRRCYTMEALYHRLCESPRDYLAAALDRFVDSFGRDQALATRWAETIHQAGLDAGDTATRTWGQRLVDGIEALAKGRFEPAADSFDALLATPELDRTRCPKALAWLGRLRFAASRFDLALTAFSRLVQLAPDVAAYWVERGLTLTRLERYREALASFDRALEIEPGNPLTIVRREEAARRLASVRALVMPVGRGRGPLQDGMFGVEFATTLELEHVPG